MKIKHVVVSAITACAMLAGSGASAAAYCYKNSSNNDHRYVVHYKAQGYDVIVDKALKQKWKGGKYVTVSQTGYRFLAYADASKRGVCKKLYGYKYAG